MPNKYTPVNPGSDLSAIVNQVNQNLAKLDAEVTTKQFKDKTGNTMLIGNLQGDQFGISMLDVHGSGLFIGLYRTGRFAQVEYKDGVPVGLVGMAPDDGRLGIWQAKPGENVITLLGG